MPPLAATCAEYFVLTCPSGSDDVVICTGVEVPDAATLMLKLFDAVCAGELESCTWMVKEKTPARVGVPEILPVDCRVSPLGRWPLATVQV